MGTRTYSRRGANGERVPVSTPELGRLRPLSRAKMSALDSLIKSKDKLPPTTTNGEPTSPSIGGFASEHATHLNGELMRQIYEAQGFDGKPEVVSIEEYAKRVADNDAAGLYLNKIMFSRAVSRDSNMDDLFYGEKHHAPRQSGWFGTGTYFQLPFPSIGVETNWEAKWLLNRVAAVYGKRLPEYRDSSGQPMDTWRAEAKQRRGAIMLGLLKPDAKTNSEFSGSETRFNEWVNLISKEFSRRYGFVHNDLGVVAAILGYDAIVIPNFVNNSGGELLVFNRSKLILSEVARKTNSQSLMQRATPALRRFKNALKQRTLERKK